MDVHSRRLRVTAICKAGGNLAISAVRTIWPLQKMAQKGMIQLQILGDLEIQEMIRTGDERAIMDANILILSRIHGEGAEECPFQAAKDKGVKIVFETDDDLTDEYRDLGRGHEIAATMKWADACTVSTAPLGKTMEQFGKPVYVLPNRLDVPWFHQVAMSAERQIKGLTIGLVGTRTHFFDWIIVLDALKIIKQKYPHVQVVTGGYPAPFMKQVPGALHMAGVPFNHYPGMLAQVDIRLLPLDLEDKFNESKSGIGAMETMAATRLIKGREAGGIPVATDCPQYRDVIAPRGTGELAENTTGAWVKALERLLNDFGYRRRMATHAHKDVMAFDVSHGLTERLQVYQEIAVGA